MLNGLRAWLISSFGAILLIYVIVTAVFISSINNSEKLEDYHSDLKTTRIFLLETHKLKEDIMMGDINGDSYEKQFSVLIKKYQLLNKKNATNLRRLQTSPIAREYDLAAEMYKLKQLYAEYDNNYNVLIYLYKLKGFKDFGLEGKMREYAHSIYEFDNRDIKLDLLTLRKHEKDFLLRKDLNYVFLFGSGVRHLLGTVSSSKTISSLEKINLTNNIYCYNKYFKLLARIDIKIGVKGKTGYLNRSKTIFDKIASHIEDLDNKLRQIKKQHKEEIRTNTYIILLVLTCFLLCVIILLTHTISNSVKSISVSFNNYVNSGFNMNAINYERSRVSEFNSIYMSFLRMTREINIFTNFFKEKVYERTLALNEQKDEMLAQQYKIESQYRDLFLKNTELKEKKLLLALKNDEVQQSLRYAKRIQKAIQPTAKKFKESFSESFIYSKAKDIVSGDFCLLFPDSERKAGEVENTIFVAADCTGHGVPGAIMSVLGINTLNKIIRELNHTDPGKIMNLLDKDINQVLAAGKKESDIVADGMELAVFSINKQTLLMKYSIARFTHFIIRNGSIIELFTYKSSIGYSFFETQAKNFSTSNFQLTEGDCLYVMSDGYADQFGGPLNTKYKRKNIKQLLLKINHLHMSEQKQIIKKEFLAWKKTQQQIDDILVIGIRF